MAAIILADVALNAFKGACSGFWDNLDPDASRLLKEGFADYCFYELELMRSAFISGEDVEKAERNRDIALASLSSVLEAVESSIDPAHIIKEAFKGVLKSLPLSFL